MIGSPQRMGATSAASHIKAFSRQKKRRNRLRKSCIPCTERHIKCDMMSPCSSCIQRRLENRCNYHRMSINERNSALDRDDSSSCVIESSNRTSICEVSEKQADRILLKPSKSQFVQFLDVCGSSLQVDASSLQKSRIDRTMLQSGQYPAEVEEVLIKMRSVLPPKAASAVQMMRRCVKLGIWVGSNIDCAIEVGLASPHLCSLFDHASDRIANASLNKFPLGNESCSDELFPSLKFKGDAARLSLALAMILGAISYSSTRLVALCYKMELPCESSMTARKQVEDNMENALLASIDLSRLHDGEEVVTTVRACLLYSTFLKDKGRIEDASSMMFHENLVEMVKRSRLHKLDDPSVCSNLDACQLESRRTLFAEFLVHDRFACAVFGHSTSLLPAEITSPAPTPSLETSALNFRVAISNILMGARDILQEGAHSYNQIEKIDNKLISLWNQWKEEAGAIKETFFRRNRARLSEACVAQFAYCTCQITLHRSCLYNPPPGIGKSSIWKSRKKCTEIVRLSVEALETIRYSMESDEIMSSFRIAWTPTETVITLLLVSIMALRETLADHRNATRIDQASEATLLRQDCIEAIELIEEAKKLAERCRQCLKSAPPDSLLAEKALLMLDRVENKADAVLSRETISYGARLPTDSMETSNYDFDTSLGTCVPYYMPSLEHTTTATTSHSHGSLSTKSAPHSSSLNSKDSSPLECNVMSLDEISLPSRPTQVTPRSLPEASFDRADGSIVSIGSKCTAYDANWDFPDLAVTSHRNIGLWNFFKQQHHYDKLPTQHSSRHQTHDAERTCSVLPVSNLSSRRSAVKQIISSRPDISNTAMENHLDLWISDSI